MNSNYIEAERKFNEYYKAAQEARAVNNFNKMVDSLRKASQCLIDMAENSPYEKKGPLMDRSRNLLDVAKQCEEAHPECFANTNQSGSGSGDNKNYLVSTANTRFSDIIGCEDVKAFVRKQYIYRFEPKYSIVFADGRGGSLERGMLLFGLPGTGKTMMARAIATEVKANFMLVKASDLKDRFHGETEKKIRDLYDEAARLSAENNRPTIIFIDEIETLIPSRSSEIQNYESSAVTEFLTVLDGFEKEKMSNIITIAASNYPGRIDAAAIRPGRLGAWFRIDVPDADLRKLLIEKHFSCGYKMESSVLSAIVKKTKGYSGADIVALCDRIKSKLADKGIAAVDKGLSEADVIAASSVVTLKDAESVLKTNNSSISETSINELEIFEKNYNFKSKNGGIVEFMEDLK